MLLIDALVGLFIFKVFGEHGLWVLAITCAITLIRTCGSVNSFFSGMLNYAQELINEEEDK